MAHPGEELPLKSAAGCSRSSAARAERDCPSVSVERRAGRAAPPPWLWRRSSVPVGQRFCCSSTCVSFGPALWWSAAARAMAIDWCSCLSMARSRRPRRRWAAPEGCPLAIFTIQATQTKKGHSFVKMAGGGGGGVSMFETLPCVAAKNGRVSHDTWEF